MKKITIIGISLILAVLMALTACTDSESTSSTVENESTNTAESSIAVSVESNESSASEFTTSGEADESAQESESSEPENSTVSDESSDASEDNSEPGDTSAAEPEILGSGTKDDPYLIFPGEDMTMSTFEIPAGKSHYYSIYRVGGLDLTLESKDAYVICDGTRYDAEKGKVAFRIIDAMASDAVAFEIGNKGSSAQAFEISFANPTGTYANPVKVSLGTDYSISLEKNNEIGYYYKYTAEKDGTLRFEMTATKESVVVVTNNRNSAQRTTEDDGETADDGTKFVEIEVQKGDELIINVGAKPNKLGKYPATDITWNCDYK